MGMSRSRTLIWDGKMSSEFELWLGDHFSSWLPSRGLLEINIDGGVHIVKPGDTINIANGVCHVITS